MFQPSELTELRFNKSEINEVQKLHDFVFEVQGFNNLCFSEQKIFCESYNKLHDKAKIYLTELNRLDMVRISKAFMYYMDFRSFMKVHNIPFVPKCLIDLI